MKLLRLRVDGFGLLRGEWTFDPARVTVVVDDNERGKTSLLHAIAAALYGLEGDGRRHRGLLTPLERWRPWDGGDYRVELTLERDGQRYDIVRDFTRGTVSVRGGRGEELAPEFRDGKDEFNVGRKLLGLDFDEFVKCAFWRQGELDDVVPDQERERRVSTLHARLEEAVDSREGKGTAVNALQVLERAMQKFPSVETGTVITVDNTVRRLEDKKRVLETEIDALEHDYRQALEPLERLTRLSEDEAELRELLARADARRRRARAEDARERLGRDAARRDRLEALRAEARALEDAAGVPLDAETRLHDLMGRLREKHDHVAAARKQLAQRAAERDRLERELVPHADLAARTPTDADRLAGAATSLRALEADDARLALEIQRGHETLAANGIDPERADALLARFEAVPVEGQRLLGEQPRFALAQQTARNAASRLGDEGEDALEAVTRWRRAWAVAGGALLVAGLGAGTAAFALAAVGLLVAAAATAAGLGLAGIALLIVARTGRRAAREEALRQVAEADGQLDEIDARDADNGRRLAELARSVGAPDGPTLLSDWAEYQRLRDLHAPVRAAHSQRAGLEHQRRAVATAVTPLLGAADAEAADAEWLDDVATRVRRRAELERARADADHRHKEVELAARAAELDAQAAEQQAAGLIAAAGLRYEPGVSWSAWIDGVAARVRQAQKRIQLVDETIPAEQAELLDETKRAALQAEIDAGGEPPTGAEAADAKVPVAEIEAEMARLRARLDQVAREREDLRLSVDAVARRYHGEHPTRVTELQAVEQELARVQKFRAAVTLARETLARVTEETHRRWAQFLDRRVPEILDAMGSRIARVRFGDDLDFRITLRDGPDDARGKALPQLSTGARDQLHLAVRLAISEYLSRGGESLPLLIDDCFATSDDDRARSGMRLLVDAVARHHQVVLVSCHRERYRAFAERDRDVYDGRVRWLSLTDEAVTES